MMNTDIRVSVSFKGHRKRKKLKMLLGPDATDYLLDLWLTTAMERPDGDLSGLDADDLAIMAGWPNDSLTFVTTLVKVGFIDVDSEGNFSLHDWIDHNAFCVAADDRSEGARFSRMAKTYPQIHAELKSKGYTGISADEYKSLTKHLTKNNERYNERSTTLQRSLTNRSTPSPSPSPSPSPLQEPSEPPAFQEKDNKSLYACGKVDNSTENVDETVVAGQLRLVEKRLEEKTRAETSSLARASPDLTD